MNKKTKCFETQKGGIKRHITKTFPVFLFIASTLFSACSPQVENQAQGTATNPTVPIEAGELIPAPTPFPTPAPTPLPTPDPGQPCEVGV